MPIRISRKQKVTTDDGNDTRSLIYFWWEYTATLESSSAVSYKIKCSVTIISSVLYIHPREMEIYVHTKPCIWISIAALVIITPAWEQSRCSSADDWLNILWYIQAIEFYWVLKRNGLCIHTAWIPLKGAILRREKSKTLKGYILYQFPFCCYNKLLQT
jgi:hypothetical protein